MATIANERFRASLSEAGLTQTELADLVGISESKLSRVLSGKRTLSLSLATQIVEKLRERCPRKRGLTVEELFSEAA